MKDESPAFIANLGFILPPSSFILAVRRRSQVVRQRSAKPLFIGSIPIAASNFCNTLRPLGIAGSFLDLSEERDRPPS